MRPLIRASFYIFVSYLLLQVFVLEVRANDGRILGILANAPANVRDKVSSVFNHFDGQKQNGHTVPKKLPVVHEKWAVLIGVDRYQDNSIAALPYARNNVLLLDKSLKNPIYGHFHPNHVISLSGANATRDHILDSLLGPTLVHRVLPSDLIVVYFAGRMLPSQSGDDLLLCTYDTLASEPSLSAIKLTETLIKLRRRTECAQIICILDSCPAGNQSWGPGKTDGITLENLSKKTGVSFLQASDLGVPALIWTPSHFSYFAEFLAEGLKATDGNVPLACLISYVQDCINKECQESRLTPTKVCLCVAPDAPDMGQVVLGQLKHYGGINPQKVQFGYDVRNLPITHPDVVVTRRHLPTIASNHIVNGSTPDDDELDKKFASVDFGPYMDKMRQDIRLKWNPPKGLENRRVVTRFSILRDGSIVDPQIVSSSGVPEADQMALAALKAASPLDHLPAGAAESVQIRYVFDWQVTSQ